MADRKRFAVVEQRGWVGSGFDPVGDERGVADGLMLLQQQLAVRRGGELDVLAGVGARADGAKHLGTVEDKLDRALGDLGGHRRKDGLRPDVALAAESTACVWAIDV